MSKKEWKLAGVSIIGMALMLFGWLAGSEAGWRAGNWGAGLCLGIWLARNILQGGHE